MPEPVLIQGTWRESLGTRSFHAFCPTQGVPLASAYPISPWSELDLALEGACQAFEALETISGEQRATFLDCYASHLEAHRTELVEIAHQETGLPASPRLGEVELPRTTQQLRLAAHAARDHAWRRVVKDPATGIVSAYAAIGPVAVFGPNNFPFAFNSVAGGDFASAIAAGNPVIAKSNSSHPGTTQRLAQLALQSVQETGLPPATVQLVYRTDHSDGCRLVADPRLGATGYTGSRQAGLTLKQAADAAGKPIYLELSSVNPVVILPHALQERASEIAQEFVSSGLMGTGQFCTSPGLLLLIESPEAEAFIAAITDHYRQAPVGTLLSPQVAEGLSQSVESWQRYGASLLVGGTAAARSSCGYANTLLRVSGEQFLRQPMGLQTEAFGNAALLVVCSQLSQLEGVLHHLEGNLTGCVYSAKNGADDAAYDHVARILRRKVGRLLNDKMPTGVAVSPAMNHGGPFPATGHPGFTAVGIPAAMWRFAALHCYDNVRPHRLPDYLRHDMPGNK